MNKSREVLGGPIMAKKGGVSRRAALKLGLASAASAAVPDLSAAKGDAKQAQQENRKPNILFLLVDEQRFPTVYESAALKQFRATHLPAQARLAQKSASFERHYAASIASVPSRVSLYTGHYPSLHGAANTDVGAKAADDPGMQWLLPGSVPTIGHYLREAGYRTFWKGKWHASAADLKVPGTTHAIASYDANGATDPIKESLYLKADPLERFGFSGWVGPDPLGMDPLRTGSSAAPGKQGRDPATSAEVVKLIRDLEVFNDGRPWFVMASFANPHDIALWAYVSGLADDLKSQYDFSVADSVPDEPFDRSLFARSRLERLDDKPSCQKSFRDSYAAIMPPNLASKDYYRLYYRLHADVDRHMGAVLNALEASPFLDNTIIVFTSNHGDLLGAHGGLHQKWYVAYEEAVHVPLLVAMPGKQGARSVPVPTSHVDIAPTLLGLAGVDHNAVRETLTHRFTDALPLVGRDLSPLLRGEVGHEKMAEPIYFMTDDDPSRGLDQKNLLGIARNSIAQPSHVETVIAEIEGEIWKYSRYFDHPRYWSAPGTPGQDGVRDVVHRLKAPESGEQTPVLRVYEEHIKTAPVASEYEMYNVSADPMELENLAGKAEWKDRENGLRILLVAQCGRKRLVPQSGVVPGEVGCREV
jgi:choline-sulfatase